MSEKETVGVGRGPQDRLRELVAVVESLIEGDCAPDVNYCWWCQEDIHGNGHGDKVQRPHGEGCRWVRAKAALAALDASRERPFSELRAKMSPESQARAAERAAELSASLASQEAAPRELEKAVRFVLDKFTAAEAAGFRSRERQFAIDILSRALASSPAPQEQP